MTPAKASQPEAARATHDDLDPVWKALANPIRREILDLLREEPKTTGDLVFEFPDLSRFAVMQHLDVLVEANLVIPKKKGRSRFNHLNAVPLQQIYERWVTQFEGHFASSLIAMKNRLEGGSSHPQPRRSASPAHGSRLPADHPGEPQDARNR